VDDWLTWLGLGAVAIYLVQRFRRRAVDPDVEDPARHLTMLLKWGCPALVAVIAGVNIAVVSIIGVMPQLLLLFVADAALLLGIAALAVCLWDRAEALRRQTGYVICEASYADAPRHIKKAMRRIYSSARAMRGGTAYQTGIFGDMPLEQLVYSAATHAVTSAELTAAIRDLEIDCGPDDRAALEAAHRRQQEIRTYLQQVEAALARTATSAETLSNHLEQPAREQAAAAKRERARAESAQRRQMALDRLEQATAQANSKDKIDSFVIEDRVTSIQAGYVEAKEASDAVLKGPTLPPAENAAEVKRPVLSAETKAAARKRALKATKWTADAATRLSRTAAKLVAEKLEKHSDEN